MRSREDSVIARVLMLLTRMGTRMTGRAPEGLEEVWASNARVRVFTHVGAMPGCMPSDLADLLALERSEISRALGQLAKLGLVLRRTDPADRRQVRVRLSAKGQRMLSAHTAAVTPAIAAILPDAEETVRLLGGELDREPDTADATLPVALDDLIRIGTRIAREFPPAEHEYGVRTAAERFALFAVNASSGPDIDQISELAGVDPLEIGASILKLERAGLVAVTHLDIDSGQRARAELTQTGRALASAYMDILRTHLDDVRTVMVRLVRSGRHSAVSSPHPGAAGVSI